MRLLLDSHVFIWLTNSPEKLSSKAREVLEDADTTLLVSAASIWELAIKYHLGKLPEATAVVENFYGAVARYGLEVVDIKPHHALLAASILHPHRDPFDRMLAAQSKLEQAPLVTADETIRLLPGLEWFW
jgi:PIN domain nuclease of toxin-antitoxin system